MEKKIVVVDFDCIGYREHLIEMKEYFTEKRDEYIYKNLMWNMYNSVVCTIQNIIDDMDDYATFKKE